MRLLGPLTFIYIILILFNKVSLFLVARIYLSFDNGNQIQSNINKYTNCNKIFFCNINQITIYYGTIDIEILFDK